MKYRVVLNFLSFIVAIITICMVIPLVYALLYGEERCGAFAAPIGVGLASAGALYRLGRGADMSRFSMTGVFASVTSAWVAASLISALPYMLCGAALSFTDAFFESMSGYTTTGSTIFPDLGGLPRSLLLWRSMTLWLGGMGIIGLTLAILPLTGTGGFHMFSAEYPGMTREKLTPRVRQTAAYLWLIYAGLTAALTACLALCGMDFFDALNHAMSVISTGGFSTRSANVGYYRSPSAEWVITVFMFLAGANFVLHFRAIKGRSLANYFADAEFRFYALTVSVLTLLASAGLFFGRGYGVADALRAGAFHVAGFITTTGFVADNYDLWPDFSKGVLFACLFMGGCAGSTAGGIKHVRLLAMSGIAGQQLRKMLNPKSVVIFPLGMSTLEPAVMSSCMAFFGLYFIVLITGAFAMSLFAPDFITALSGAAAALGNVGQAFGNFGAGENFVNQTAAAKWIYAFLMLCGRLELYTIFALFAGFFRRSAIRGAD